MPDLGQKGSRISLHCPIPQLSFSPAEGMGPRAGAEPGQPRAALAEQGVCVLSASLAVTAQTSVRGSWLWPCHQQSSALVPVPPGTAGSGQGSLPTGALCTALQCRSATTLGMLTGLRHPWQCSGAKVRPATPHWALGAESLSFSSSASVLLHELPGLLGGQRGAGKVCPQFGAPWAASSSVAPGCCIDLPLWWSRAGSPASLHSCVMRSPEGWCGFTHIHASGTQALRPPSNH